MINNVYKDVLLKKKFLTLSELITAGYTLVYIYMCNYHLIQIRNFHSNIISRYAIDRESLHAGHCHIRFS